MGPSGGTAPPPAPSPQDHPKHRPDPDPSAANPGAVYAGYGWPVIPSNFQAEVLFTSAKPPWKSGKTCPAWLTSAVHAVVPSLVMAWTVPSAWNANTSATPLVLGTAGTIDWTPDPSPGLDQITVPKGSGSAETVTSADAVPAVMVTSPAARAVSSGGSSVDRPTIVGSLESQVSPARGSPAAFNAWMVCVSPTDMLSRLGTSVLPPVAGTANGSALLHAAKTRATQG